MLIVLMFNITRWLILWLVVLFVAEAIEMISLVNGRTTFLGSSYTGAASPIFTFLASSFFELLALTRSYCLRERYHFSKQFNKLRVNVYIDRVAPVE